MLADWPMETVMLADWPLKIKVFQSNKGYSRHGVKLFPLIQLVLLILSVIITAILIRSSKLVWWCALQMDVVMCLAEIVWRIKWLPATLTLKHRMVSCIR